MNNLERVRKKNATIGFIIKWASVDHLLWPVNSAEPKEKRNGTSKFFAR